MSWSYSRVQSSSSVSMCLPNTSRLSCSRRFGSRWRWVSPCRRTSSDGCTRVSRFSTKSIPAYPSGAHTRSFRFGRGLIRLAVTLATHPFSKVSRAFTMSSCPPNACAPRAYTSLTGLRTSDRIRSRSWIIRSRTTPMSVDRPVNGPCRSASISLGVSGRRIRFSNAGLNRSMCPTWNGTPRLLAISTSSSAWARVVVIGFSTRTGMPRSRNDRAIVWW